MKSNDDKLIREKLSGTEFPFNPEAWAQMETMLDKKKKHRVFFWWWTGGIAAVLLLAVGTIGWGLYLMKEDDGLTGELATNTPEIIATETQATSVTSYEEVGSGSGQVNVTPQVAEVVNGKGEVNTTANLISATGLRKLNNNSKQEKAKAVAKSKSKKQGTENATASVRINSANPRYQRSDAFSEGKQKGKVNQEGATENPFKHEVDMLNAAAQKSLAENILMNRSEASLLSSVSENAEPAFDKMEQDVLPKQKKKIFNYSLGVLANVSGTTLGSQPTNAPERPPLFHSAPSYMAGFTHDFLFAKRFAISNSILYSQTSFNVYQPKSISFERAPLEYSSKITELAIPIGVKVYPVAKNNIRFYIGAGIINHIKLKETFNYVMPVDTPTNIIPPVTPNYTATTDVPPLQTDFNGNGFPYEKAVIGGLSSTEYVNTNDFSINSAKRYYASFYASAGVEYVVKKHFLFFAEPEFHMSLQKIGVQDNRKYNLGLNAGVRYIF